MDPSIGATVLVVDDDADIGQLMQDFLEAQGFNVLRASDGASALALCEDDAIDCVLLDILMPGISGLDVLRRIRTTSEVPVIILSARQDDSDKIRGLDLGADDYVVKSASPSEVVARVQALLRRTRRMGSIEEILDFGRLVIVVPSREVTVDGDRVLLTPREFDLLLHLARNPRRVFSREQLVERFWGEYGSEHSLTVHIGRIREKLEKDPSKPEIITTVWGVGYRFEDEHSH